MHVLQSWVRVFCDARALDDVVDFYRGLTGGEVTLRYGYKEQKVRMAGVRSPALSVLVVAGEPAARRPFEAIALTLEVDDLDAVKKAFTYIGGEVMEEKTTEAGTRTLFVKHPDGLLAEYVPHQPPRRAAAEGQG
ncbi:VOC family protein [Caenispirillum bisanense]|uniref:VOC family protein n=1 Tax=Caenispirillum bisanense TaxID=414052 RepID=UPI0031D19BBA